MKPVFLLLSLAFGFTAQPQTSLIYKRQRPPQLDVSIYKQIAVGDIVGPLNAKTEESLDLTDALTAKLFSANTLEVIDRNALDNILGAQRFKDLQTMDDQTKQMLNKKLGNALLITGRLQSGKLEQKLIYEDQSIVVNGCSRTYFYQVKGDVAIQLKIWDVKTGRMLLSDAVIVPVDKRTKEDCKVGEKLDVGEISRTAIKDLSVEIAKLVAPYDVSTTLLFSDPGLFKSPFKQLKAAISHLQANNTDAGLPILRDYTESKDVKDKNRFQAWWNYGIALMYAGKYAEARTALQNSASLNGANVTPVATLTKLMDDDELAARKLETQRINRLRQAEAPEPTAETAPPKAAPKASKAKTRKA